MSRPIIMSQFTRAGRQLFASRQCQQPKFSVSSRSFQYFRANRQSAEMQALKVTEMYSHQCAKRQRLCFTPTRQVTTVSGRCKKSLRSISTLLQPLCVQQIVSLSLQKTLLSLFIKHNASFILYTVVYIMLVFCIQNPTGYQPPPYVTHCWPFSEQHTTFLTLFSQLLQPSTYSKLLASSLQ